MYLNLNAKSLQFLFIVYVNDLKFINEKTMIIR